MTHQIEFKVYGETVTLVEVTPEDRAEDVLYYLITRKYRGGRTLEGVNWKATGDIADE